MKRTKGTSTGVCTYFINKVTIIKLKHSTKISDILDIITQDMIVKGGKFIIWTFIMSMSLLVTILPLRW